MQLNHFKDFNDRLMISNPKHSFRQHRIDRPGTLIPVSPHLTIKKKYNCLIESLSCGGAMINLSPYVLLPRNFFLVILGSTEEIGSTEVRREGDRMMIKFNMFLDPGFLEKIVGRASIEADTMEH
jgi:hypothetical protein